MGWVRHPKPTLPTTETINEAVPGKPVERNAPPANQGEWVTCFTCKRDIPVPANLNDWHVRCPACRVLVLTPVGRKACQDHDKRCRYPEIHPSGQTFAPPALLDYAAPPATPEECVTCFSCNLNIPVPANSNTGWVQCPSCRDLWLTPVGRKSFENGRIAFEDHAKPTTEITAQEFNEQSGEAESGKKRRRKKRKTPEEREEAERRDEEKAEKREKRQKWVKYVKYLESRTWKRKRRKALKRDGGKCVMCGEHADHVHHREYPEKLGTEPVESLTSLCSECHRKLHGRSEDDWGLKR